MATTSYFDEVVGSLTSEDTNLLGVLVQEDATANFKAIKNAAVQEAAGLSEAMFRKITTRLVALKFIEPNTGFKEHALFVTPYGQAALGAVLRTMEVGA